MKIAPSILSADFSILREEINSINTADYLHFDVMDGLFVPNISIGIPVLESVRKTTDMVLDVHLMIDAPHRYVGRFADAGADIVVFHLETENTAGLQNCIDEIHKRGKKAGIAIKPGTAAEEIIPWLGKIELALVMTVEPGFGGQKFMPDMVPKMKVIRKIIDENGYSCELEVDGGINPDTAKICAASGVDVLVAGSDIFKSQDRLARIKLLRG